MQVVDEINEAIKMIDKIDESNRTISERISQNDLAISDLYHYIENNTFNSKTSYRMIKELKEKLIYRRELKEEETILRAFDNNKNKLLHPDNRKMLIAEIGKTEKRLSTPYNYRIYCEEDLRDKIEN